MQENTHCKICNIKKKINSIAMLLEGHLVVKCMNCGVKYISPTPDDKALSEYYKQYYLTRDDISRKNTLVGLHNNIIEYFSRYIKFKDAKVLDVGFGNGAFLKCATQKRIECYGAEISKQNIEQLSDYCSKNNVRIPTMNINDNIDAFDQKFELITFFQIIEHMQDPYKLMSEYSKLQNIGGFIYLECPNNDALLNRIKKVIYKVSPRKSSQYYESLKFPEHLYGFNIKSLSCLMRRLGYEIVDIGDYYYSDYIHQVESVYWWPAIWRVREYMGLTSIFKSFYQLLDMLSSRLFSSGSGIFLLARLGSIKK